MDGNRTIFLTAMPTALACYAYRIAEQYQLVPHNMLIANDGVHAAGSAALFSVLNTACKSPYLASVFTFCAGGMWEIYQMMYMGGMETRDLWANVVGITTGVVVNAAKYLEKPPADLEERLLLP